MLHYHFFGTTYNSVDMEDIYNGSKWHYQSLTFSFRYSGQIWILFTFLSQSKESHWFFLNIFIKTPIIFHLKIGYWHLTWIIIIGRHLSMSKNATAQFDRCTIVSVILTTVSSNNNNRTTHLCSSKTEIFKLKIPRLQTKENAVIGLTVTIEYWEFAWNKEFYDWCDNDLNQDHCIHRFVYAARFSTELACFQWIFFSFTAVERKQESGKSRKATKSD